MMGQDDTIAHDLLDGILCFGGVGEICYLVMDAGAPTNVV